MRGYLILSETNSVIGEKYKHTFVDVFSANFVAIIILHHNYLYIRDSNKLKIGQT